MNWTFMVVYNVHLCICRYLFQCVFCLIQIQPLLLYCYITPISAFADVCFSVCFAWFEPSREHLHPSFSQDATGKKRRKKKERRNWHGCARLNLSTYGLRMGNVIVWGHVDLHNIQKNQDYTENLYKVLENKGFFKKNLKMCFICNSPENVLWICFLVL